MLTGHLMKLAIESTSQGELSISFGSFIDSINFVVHVDGQRWITPEVCLNLLPLKVLLSCTDGNLIISLVDRLIRLQVGQLIRLQGELLPFYSGHHVH
ncbi:hypothetical protein BABINDRAFT_92683 [Babjeviella inositovora NRRL Y-12698]|uniref:Uncharacterized protein n=1 Tax=Babjeviella inositovora NRRL Y-12698 TaxID=984486 RepID=A0A1E3QKX6_9ASCO|nr:uncharacterized protein BABINDRAFT_92683 [Babjeviella inositovora NRRL Y-12698]ODQ78114.1 hypothetical protein BABINDRAFT_92683 [Babjeviella inositovora NRRL Y-12698]